MVDVEADTAATGGAETKGRPGLSRRHFLRRVGGVAVATGAGFPVGPRLASAATTPGTCTERGPLKGRARRNAAYDIRVAAADTERTQPLAEYGCSGDDDRYPTRFASFFKGLPHDKLGEVDLTAYTALLSAIETGRNELYEAIPLGGTRRLVNPHAAMTYALEGADSHDFAIEGPPPFDSANRAADMVELYWMALTRDVPFASYATDPVVARAVADLSRLSDFRGPKEGATVTPRTIFRGRTPGDLAGPFLSQFLLKDVADGPALTVQRYRGAPEGADYLSAFAQWLSAQRGEQTSEGPRESTARYIRDTRDLAEWVHRDYPFQAGVNAALILMDMPGTADPESPYATSRTQDPFCTFGRPFVLDLVARVANAALRAAWFQKWALHRTLRPEAYGGRVHNHVIRAATYPIHSDLLVTSTVLAETKSKFGTYLLPTAYAEGSPLHPAFPSGHATFAGATVTVLKALFNEAAVVPSPVAASADGLSLVPYTDGVLTVGNELNKLAANVALGRCAAGVHYRSDAAQGLLLGEAVASRVLLEVKSTLTETYGGFSFTRFDGTAARI
jgi:membrane-associated phospholipid phosphatase